MSKLLHYCEKKFTLIKDEHQKTFAFKPRGLYLSIDDTWIKWCMDEEFYHRDYQWIYEFEIHENANILKIETMKDLDDFVETYKLRSFEMRDFEMIRWDIVKKQYSGIAFLNYQKMKRQLCRELSIHCWFLALDVDCYVIWDHEILKEKSCIPFSWDK